MGEDRRRIESARISGGRSQINRFNAMGNKIRSSTTPRNGMAKFRGSKLYNTRIASAGSSQAGRLG
jgi:hypothetical protein